MSACPSWCGGINCGSNRNRVCCVEAASMCSACDICQPANRQDLCSPNSMFQDRVTVPVHPSGTGSLLVSVAVFERLEFVSELVSNALRYTAPDTRLILHMSAQTVEYGQLQCIGVHPEGQPSRAADRLIWSSSHTSSTELLQHHESGRLLINPRRSHTAHWSLHGRNPQRACAQLSPCNQSGQPCVRLRAPAIFKHLVVRPRSRSVGPTTAAGHTYGDRR
jgi:hypothetical protein